eukprot:CAMPEP_0171455046 /NCGR_PEP_ID=MMETSP0945-20130129/2096_1 /TAXON_ID=109269 /ORGANISM="Vaucheria litorea, Strain CCMP2940" /LENGTH=415 /DNA_ID=CAMNT_0011980205 /DNA_START=210 /DNA_END=1454 /DNA_ORIENTATION=-
MAVFEMIDQESADNFYLEFDGKPFSSMEDQILCCANFVWSIQYGEECERSNFNEASKNQPITLKNRENDKFDSCVICMEHLGGPGTLTTTCNHTFHMDCIERWQDTTCPVCRYHHYSTSDNTSCEECGAFESIHVCLLCGYIGCGDPNDESSHIHKHHLSTLHTYAHNIETLQVWDFAGGGFVHRLIHNKVDGKLVEVDDPQHPSYLGERPHVITSTLSDVQEECLIHGKLEGLALNYNSLLTSQMNQQRTFYEKQISELIEEQESKQNDGIVTGSDIIVALRKEKSQLANEVMKMKEKIKQSEEKITFQEELFKSLEANKDEWERELASSREDVLKAEEFKSEMIPKLENKVRELMLKLDNSTKNVNEEKSESKIDSITYKNEVEEELLKEEIELNDLPKSKLKKGGRKKKGSK